MSNHYLTRIVTFVVHPRIPGTPKDLLFSGSRVLTLGEKRRWFTVRKVYYDESMTPIYSTPDFNEQWYESVDEIREKNPNLAKVLFDAPILDRDNSFKVWNDDLTRDKKESD